MPRRVRACLAHHAHHHGVHAAHGRVSGCCGSSGAAPASPPHLHAMSFLDYGTCWPDLLVNPEAQATVIVSAQAQIVCGVSPVNLKILLPVRAPSAPTGTPGRSTNSAAGTAGVREEAHLLKGLQILLVGEVAHVSAAVAAARA